MTVKEWERSQKWGKRLAIVEGILLSVLESVDRVRARGVAQFCGPSIRNDYVLILLSNL
jgi:hypothetical protein